MAVVKVSMELAGRTLSIETGRWAKQASGSVVVQYGDTVVLAAVTAAKEVREGQDFFPLTVDYREKTYAAGRIPGGFIKREGRQKDSEILVSRLIDRPMRPLFPKGYLNEVAVSLTVLSSDRENESDIPAMIAASAAVCISEVPFSGPVAAVRIGRVNGEFVVNPTFEQMKVSDMEMIVSANRESVMMVEGGADFATEVEVLNAIDLAHAEIRKIVDLQENLVRQAGKTKAEVPLKIIDSALEAEVRAWAVDKMKAAIATMDKLARQDNVAKVKADCLEALAEKYAEKTGDLKAVLEDIEVGIIRSMIANDSIRPDGRKMNEIRPISIETSVLPRTHGSAVFTRGQTQALAVATLGTKRDSQRIEELEGEVNRTYYLHYNFPSYSVGETKPNRGPGRREIGHGFLAEKAIEPALPKFADFPYTLRVVSEILESNGSSSMASVCGGCLSLMDAGVPIKNPVAGIAMGLIKEGDKYVVLTDIQGLEDHFGDMDFKVAGSAEGISAIQMDIKINGLSREIMEKALAQAKEARLEILGKMKAAMPEAREGISEFAPQIKTVKINPEKIGSLIGPGGKIIKAIQEETQSVIEIDEDGTVSISAEGSDNLLAAVKRVQDTTAEAEEGKVYLGRVVKITDFGAFVNILPNLDGLCHISELDESRVERVEDVVREGDEILVKCLAIDSKSGKIRLSRKEALKEQAG